MQYITRRLALPLLLTPLFASAACQEAPRGDSGGRVSVGSTTRGEADSGLMRSSDLVTASDDIAVALAQDVDQMVTQDFSGQRVTVVFGDLLNKTSKMSTTDFEFVRDRIKSKLMDSRVVRNNARFVENRSRRESLRQRELGQTGEQKVGHTSDLPQPSVNEEFFLFLNGNMYSVDRPDTRLYYMKFELIDRKSVV